MIRTIIFDFGGVLGTNSDGIFFKILAKHGLSKEESLEIWEKHWHKMKIGDEHVDAVWRTATAYTKTDINELSADYNSLIAVDEDMLALCRELKNKGYQLGILANETYEWMDIKIEKGKLSEIFNIVYSSAGLKLMKPMDDAYLKILEDLNAKPEETIFIDDLERNTIVAERLGIKSIVFKDINLLKRDLEDLSII